VTVATNVAGRGVDILLGGNPPTPEIAEQVRAAGGLHVIGTERHEARRIDNQLRGRSGRQGDPGSTQFFLSVEDDLLRIFGGDKLKSLMDRFDLPEDEPIEFGFVSKAVAEAQAKVEGANFDIRKHLLEYDDVLNKQRGAIYKRRQEFMGMLNKEELTGVINEAAYSYLETTLGQITADAEESANNGGAPETPAEDSKAKITRLLKDAMLIKSGEDLPAEPEYPESYRELIAQRSAEIAENPMARNQLLSILDMLWMTNLEDLDALQESVGLRAYGQRDPLVEYRQEASRLFKSFWGNFNGWIFGNIFKLGAAQPGAGNGAAVVPSVVPAALATANASNGGAAGNSGADKVGRNDPCPCGSGKKYKKCHGK
jgi:preprotein translocase subunit SecA